VRIAWRLRHPARRSGGRATP